MGATRQTCLEYPLYAFQHKYAPPREPEHLPLSVRGVLLQTVDPSEPGLTEVGELFFFSAEAIVYLSVS